MSHDLLILIWFILLGVLLAGYAVLDGFDLGVGMLHLFVGRNDVQRRIAMNSIGPLWDGNEVWLVTFGGAMFAAFREAYATIFSGFYTAFMLLLFALILRAVSMEFRSKLTPGIWRNFWDVAFALGSFLATLLFGVAVGNAIYGIPLDAHHEYTGSLFDQLHPYALLVGVLAVTLFLMHGAIYLYLKTEGEMQQRVEQWVWRTFGLYLVMFIFATMVTLVAVPHAIENIRNYPILWVVPALNVLAIANIPRSMFRKQPGWAFISSCCTIMALVFLLGCAIFPNMVTATDPENNLTIYKAACSQRTLGIMLIIAVIGMPCVLAYTAVIYWTFRGKVQIGEHSY